MPDDFQIGVTQAVYGTAAMTVNPNTRIPVDYFVESVLKSLQQRPEATVAGITDMVQMVVTENTDVNVGAARNLPNLLGNETGALAGVPGCLAHVDEHGVAGGEDNKLAVSLPYV